MSHARKLKIDLVGQQAFLPLISKSSKTFCEIDVTFLRQQAPGQLIGEGGDIDNRAKTLLDAMRMPSRTELDQISSLSQDVNPDLFFCLLQDDSLITKLTVETDRLLRSANDRDLVAVVKIRVRLSSVTFDNIDWG